MFQKEKGKNYITVSFASGEIVVIDGPKKEEAQMRAFAQKINNAGRHYAE